jgi:NADPH-dependent curcumin reductase
MTTGRNRQVRLKARPEGIPQAHHFELGEAPVPEIGPGQILVRNRFLSVDPAMRGWVSDVANYAPPVPIGAVMRSIAAAEVVESRAEGIRTGEKLVGMFGWQDWAAASPKDVLWRATSDDFPLSVWLGVLGLNGLTAYFGLLDVGQPREGETVVVSTAAGSVGSAVGQIAKLHGCRTVGIAGGAQKVRLCRDEFGFDAAIDYRAEGLDAAIASACPKGVDVYFDNTAGAVSDAVRRHLAVGARVVICGTASVASWDPPPMGPRVERQLLVKRARFQGFVVLDYAARYTEALEKLAVWVRVGKIRWREDVLDGIEAAPDAIAGLYRGENMGKRIIRL